MCGIIGYVGENKTLQVLITGLENLEYRGYDSAGIAYFNQKVNIIKQKGKIENLKKEINFNQNINIGIGHTRWATHGSANKINSHPHKVGKITLVHNGIIENYLEIKESLINKGYKFITETDSEVVCALIDYLYKKTYDMNKTLEELKNKVIGSYAISILNDNEENTIYTIKNKSPLIIGLSDNENYISSDINAISKYTNKFIILDDEEIGIITNDKVKIYNKKEIKKEIHTINKDKTTNDLGEYEHYMLKEIHESPTIIKNNFATYTKNTFSKLIYESPNFNSYNKIYIVACGSAYHAGCIGKNLIEEFANKEVVVEVASEFRYNKKFITNNDLLIIISQSGETADSLASLEFAKQKGIDTLGIINVENSSIARKSDYVLYTKAGNEIAVATTKAYSSQVALMSLIALMIPKMNDKLKKDKLKEILLSIKELPDLMENVINYNYKNIANKLYESNDIYFIGRGIDYNLAMEGSLKLKEISYIHSEAYPAGELKHGTISLIDNSTNVIAIITDSKLAIKTLSNIKEVKARGAKVTLITNDESLKYCADNTILIPKTNYLLQPLLTVLPLQLLSYEIAKLRKTDIDKPKNLAKSVTVE